MTGNLVVNDKVITKHLMSELPFMATENIMMDAVKDGASRQEMHEVIRTLSMKAGKNVKKHGKENNLLELIADDEHFNLSLEELQEKMNPADYVGRAPRQVEKYLAEVVEPAMQQRAALRGATAEITV